MEKTIVSFDWAIKSLLRDKANFDILSGLLSELLGKEVAVVGILESERNRTHRHDKGNKLDLKAEIEGGEIAIFEVQVGRECDFLQRILFGTSTAVTEQLAESDEYGKIKKVYSVGIVYFELGKGTDYVYRGTTDFKGVHNNETLILSEFEEKFIPERQAGDLFPEYFLIYPKRFDENIRDKFDEWVYTFKNSAVKGEFTAAGIQAAGEKLNVQKMTPAQREEHNDFIKWRRVRTNEVKSALEEERAKIKDELKKKDDEIAQKDGVIAQKDGEIAQKDGEIAQKDGIIAQKDEDLRKLREEINKIKAQLGAMGK